jgi:two-component system KDP operon response regulator KdpE
MRHAHILLVDDEVALQKTMAPLLRGRGYEVTIAGTAHEALVCVERDRPDLIVLDLGLPDLDGIEVCRRVRARWDLPILVLSARDGERDKVAALDEGADDYVTKPFSPEELLARVRVALRRVFGSDRPDSGQLQRGDLTIDFDRRRVIVGNTEVRLTPKEFELLALMARHAGQVLTNVRVLMGQLRKKVEPDPARPRYLMTEPWVGYRFAADDD